jgi:2,3-oxidosqualene cyclase
MTQAYSRTEGAIEALDCLERTWEWLGLHQCADGCWEGEVVWCAMITAQYVIAQRILGRTIDSNTRAGIIRYFSCVRQGAGWGLHPESDPYVFVTTLVYVALRLLGVPPDDSLVRPAREWLLSQPGGVAAIPSWGKFWLSLIGLYEYSGMNPVPPELFLAPRWLPVHPDKLYCHTRYIYLGIAYLYGRKFRVELPETVDLRRELYRLPYESVDFASYRHRLAPSDVYVPPSAMLRRAYDVLTAADRLCPPRLRRTALAHCASRILYEQRASRFQGISPVNGILNTLALKDLGHLEVEASLEGLECWRWEDEKEGVRFAGARSQTWDTAFVMQCHLEYGPAIGRQREGLRRAYRFLRDTQMVAELEGSEQQARARIAGGWCFSDGEHRWPVSDCTAEALSAILAAHESPGLIDGDEHPNVERLSDERLALAAEFILARQNADGGFGTYEARRGGRLLEKINPSEMFGQCMTEGSYVECTASAVKALARFERHFPNRCARARAAIARACSFLRSSQRADGSYAGFWGINFTYAGLFAVEALQEAGAGRNDPHCRRVAEWLMARQRPDGGWGEHHASCLDGVYREHPESQSVMTAWAVLALLQMVGPEEDAVQRGIRWLLSHQDADGSWPREAVNGVFFGSAMLDYRLYRIYFPAWALARYARMAERRPEYT